MKFRADALGRKGPGVQKQRIMKQLLLYLHYSQSKAMTNFYLFLPFLVTYVCSWCLKYTISESNKVRSADYSPDGTMIALGMDDNSVKIYDAYTYDVKWSFNAPNKPYAVRFNGLSTVLAVGSLNDNIKIVNLATYAITNIASTQTEVYSIDFNSDSTVMGTCGKDNELRMWNTATWAVITPTLPSQGGTDFKSCEFTSTNNFIVGDSAGAVRIFASPYLIANVVGSGVNYGNPITSVSGRYTTVDYIASENNNKKGWQSLDNSVPIYTTAPAKNVDTSAYARTLDYFMFGGAEKKVMIYNGTNKNNSLVQSFATSGNIMSSDFSNDGRYLVVGADDNLAMIYTQYCMQCDVSYIFNATTKVCDLCATYIEGCGACYSITACAVCYQGYYLTAAKICTMCNTAMLGCGLCTNSSYCTTPLPGYYLSSNVPATCQSIMPGCLICNSGTVCLECHNEYYLNTGNNKCTACSTLSNCLKCYNSTYCTQCEMGYYPNTAVANTATCSRCATNCLDCQSPTLCFECVIGYYTTGTTCQQCSANCLACNNTNYCIDCATNMYLSAGSCVACTIPCLTCVTAATTCLSCYSGYYYDGTSACVLCPTGCTSCTGSAVCMTCAEGYYYVSASTSCTKCTTTYSNCQSCNSTNCTICLTSFYYDSTANLCKSCATQMHGCVLCSSSTTCLFCAPGHYLSALTGNNSCQPCALGCGTCETGTNCTSCVPGYYFDSSTFTCLRCTSKCTTCTSPTFCLSCILGYYMQNTATGTCLACNATKPYCLACIFDASNTLQCNQCGVGFYLNSGSCSRCNPGCVTCSSGSACLSCQLGFYLNGTDSTCMTCSPYCAECTVNGTCQSCQVGYYFSSPNCISCSTLGCLTCKNNLKCLTCAAGSYLITASQLCDSCSTPLPNCLQCNSATVCTQCAYGYALVTAGANVNCVTCSTVTGCFHCSSLSVCLACQSGYYLNGNVCTPCVEGCQTCVNGTYCMTCGTSYFSGNVLGGANVGTCLRCEFYLDGCELCQNNTDCSNCQSGYYLATVGSNTLCKLCEINIPYCSMCNTSTLCTSCKGGYHLASNSLSCIQCSTTFTACRLCDRLGTVCTDCQSSYYLGSGNTCLLCSGNLPGCQVCNGGATCVQCMSGYFLNSPNCQLCSSTMPGCIFCAASNVCQQCQGGYYLSASNLCVPCAVVGCEVCVEAASTSCVTCNSLYYKSSATACTLCRSSLVGCLTCSSAAACTKCDVGYYQNSAGASPQCLLCSDAMEGCSICTSNSVCLECKSMYFLNSTAKCQTCSVPMTGCTFCTNNSVCLSCGSGYFKNSSSRCQSCTDLPGCLVCKDAATCLFCDTGYYFSTFTCQSCSVISGCYSCISSSVCTSCIGGYALNSNSGCDVAQVKGSEKVTDLMLKTFYVDVNTLKHYLYVKGMAFSKVNLNWQTNAGLYMYSDNGTKINLVIKDVQWATDNNYTLIFFTDNPIDLRSKTKKMPFARLLSQSIDLANSKTGIELSDQAIQQLLPGYQHSGSLVLDYKLDNPEFYASFTKEYTSNFPFYAIGAAITAILFLKFLLKSLATVPKSPNMGNIIPHILAFKVGALLLFPTYFEYISYCSGFMYADFPWLNRFFGSQLADSRDTSPAAYSLFYDNRNLASMYLLALSIFILLVIVAVLVGKSLPKYQYKMNAFLTFLYNFFAFGMFFAGCASLQGAIVNPISSLNVNAAFYIMGILLYFILLCECIYKVSQDKALNFWKVRILMKATLLSLSHYSPIYLLASTVVIDLVLIIVEYQLNPYSKTYSKSWIFANVTCNLALILLVFLPIIELTMVLVSVALFLVIVAEAIMHYQETRENMVVSRLDMTENDDTRNMWDLNFTDKQIKKSMETSENFYGKTKAGFTTNEDDNRQTMYVPKQGKSSENRKEDFEQTQVFGSKYKRQRNYKKVREQTKGKRMQVDDIQNRSNPNNNSNENNQQPNLTFVMQDIDGK